MLELALQPNNPKWIKSHKDRRFCVCLLFTSSSTAKILEFGPDNFRCGS